MGKGRNINGYVHSKRCPVVSRRRDPRPTGALHMHNDVSLDESARGPVRTVIHGPARVNSCATEQRTWCRVRLEPRRFFTPVPRKHVDSRERAARPVGSGLGLGRAYGRRKKKGGGTPAPSVGGRRNQDGSSTVQAHHQNPSWLLGGARRTILYLFSPLAPLLCAPKGASGNPQFREGIVLRCFFAFPSVSSTFLFFLAFTSLGLRRAK